MTLSSLVHNDPEILSGTPVFVGTRVPARILFEFLSAGDTLDEFLDAYPSVKRQQAVDLLQSSKASSKAVRVLLDESVPRQLGPRLEGIRSHRSPRRLGRASQRRAPPTRCRTVRCPGNG